MSAPIQYRAVHEMPEGVPFEIWLPYGHKKITVTRFKSDGKVNSYGRRMFALEGSYAHAWICDPCGQAIDESLHAARLNESKTAHEDRMARRKAKDQLAAEAQKAKSQPPRRRAW